MAKNKLLAIITSALLIANTALGAVGCSGKLLLTQLALLTALNNANVLSAKKLKTTRLLPLGTTGLWQLAKLLKSATTAILPMAMRLDITLFAKSLKQRRLNRRQLV